MSDFIKKQELLALKVLINQQLDVLNKQVQRIRTDVTTVTSSTSDNTTPKIALIQNQITFLINRINQLAIDISDLSIDPIINTNAEKILGYTIDLTDIQHNSVLVFDNIRKKFVCKVNNS